MWSRVNVADQNGVDCGRICQRPQLRKDAAAALEQAA